MGNTVSVIGIAPAELRWIRMLVILLRNPDPSVPELARQALIYLTGAAARRLPANPETRNPEEEELGENRRTPGRSVMI